MRSMAHAPYIRAKAREMRVERRLTIDQIADRLALPRSTIYYWVRDLPITDAVRHSGPRQAARRRGNRAMQRKYRLLREAAYREGLESFASLAVDPTFRDFVCLYIAEGYKRSRNVVSIVNSDPAVVRVAAIWIRRLAKRSIDYRISYHADQNLGALRSFWGSELGVNPHAIACQRKTNSGQLSGRIWRCEHGLLTIRTSDTLFRARLDAWIVCLKREWSRG
jgi:hypothetical protein